MLEIILDIAPLVLILMTAIVVHEYAHGWVANKLGDPTAKMAGRLTLNPLKHIDPVGTIILPGVLIILRSMHVPVFPVGWAKPVPVNFMRLRNPKRDMIFVGMAGPFVNMAMAVIATIALKFPLGNPLKEFLALFIMINVLLAVFNMLPIPPLDGSRLIMGLLPNQYVYQYARLEPFGIIIVILLLNIGVFDKVIMPAVDFIIQFLGYL